MADEQWWIFTFGCGQEHAGHYVRIFGTFEEARRKMCDRFGQRWAMQYSQGDWDEWVDRADSIGVGKYVETEMPFPE